MSTNGIYGITKNGKTKEAYNHCDSYPEGLGADIIKFCNNNDVDALSKLYDNIEIVDENSKPTDEQINRCIKNGWANFNVSTKSSDDWYCLLRELQGNFEEYQKCIDNDETVYMLDGSNCYYDFKYIINLDYNTLEYYVGWEMAMKFDIDKIDSVSDVVNQMDDIAVEKIY